MSINNNILNFITDKITKYKFRRLQSKKLKLEQSKQSLDEKLDSVNKNIKLLSTDEKSESIEHYEKLSPINTNDDLYLKEIDYAILEEDITNVALSGPYGIGKSSILKTYKSKRRMNTYLSISLANFIKREVNESGEVKSSIVLAEELESNILKQMFYKVKHEQIPFSRYRRIKNLTNKNITKLLICIVLLIFSGAFIYNPLKMNKLFDYKINELLEQNLFTVVLALVIFIPLSYMLLVKLVKYIKANLRVNNVKIKSMDVSKFDEKDFIFNKNMDEIMYFFEATKYDVIIFEDLDRFNNIDIFIKLRELNEIINDSKQIGRKVTFIYAIKDDIFANYKDRTKFFDFIIPVVPIINSSNSVKYLNDRLSNFDIDKELMETISIYVDDMRILKNICNEFNIYRGIVNYKDINKLFSMITYKNLYHNDFVKLQFNKGILYKAFNFDYRKEVMVKITQKSVEDAKTVNLEYDNRILKLKNEYLYEVNEILFDEAYLSGIFCEDINEIFNDRYDVKTRLELTEHYYNGAEGNTRTHTFVKGELLKVGQNNNYYSDKKVIDNWKKNRLSEINDKLEEDTNILIHDKLHKSIKRFSIDEVIYDENIKNEKLISYFIEEGYIDEEYHSYIVHNKNGIGSENDINYLNALKTNQNVDLNHYINDPLFVLNRIGESDCKKLSILNYELFNFIVENRQDYIKYYEIILEYITTGINSNKSIDLRNSITDYINNVILSRYRETVLIDLTLRYSWFWDYIYINNTINEDIKGKCLVEILNNLPLDKIVDINNSKILVGYIESKNFIKYVESDLNKSKFRKIKEELNVNSSKINLNKGILANEQSDHDEAIKYCKWAIEDDNTNLNAYNLLGDSHKFKGEYESAIDYYMNVIDIDKTNVEAYIKISEIYRLQEKYMEAIDIIIIASKIEPLNEAIKSIIYELNNKIKEVALSRE